MNIARLIVGSNRRGALTHLLSETARVTRTAEELEASIAALSSAYLEIGIAPRDAVLIIGGSRVEIAEAILAAFNVGAVAVPVTPMLGTEHLIAIIERMRPRLCVFEDPPAPAVLTALSAIDCLVISIRTSADAAENGWGLYRDLLDRDAGAPTHPDFADDQPALVVHGSGSSGNLKSMLMSHGEVIRFVEYTTLVWSQYLDGPDLRFRQNPMVVGLPMAHLAGLCLCLQGLFSGRNTYFLGFFQPDVYLRLIEDARCSAILLVPSLYRSLLKEPRLQQLDLSALEFCITSGEPCPDDLASQVEAAFGAPMITAYGMSECLSGIGHGRRELFGGHVKRGSCGRQLFGEVSLRDSEGREHPGSGELWVRNATVHPCYLDATLNEEKFRDGWFRTGDLFCRDSDGDFFHRGRVDDMFICNGRNIYPLEIELLLMRHAAVEAACAAPVSLGSNGQAPAVMIVPRAPIDPAAIQDFAMKHGASHAVPQLVLMTDQLPLIGPGKLDRVRVRHLLQQAYEQDVHRLASLDPV